MKIRGLSYQNGIFYIGRQHVACAYHEKGRLKSWIKPINVATLGVMMKQITLSMPIWFKLFTFFLVGLIFIPKIVTIFYPINWNGLPYYFLLYYIFGTHFIFPKQLRQYHGAEHKVFSDKGVIRRARLPLIKKASITNRYCSTNIVVIYFLSVILIGSSLAAIMESGARAVEVASYSSLLLVPIIQRLMNIEGFGFVKKVILSVSYWLQIHVTTTEPERRHMIASIESYRKLASKEFPDKLVVKRPVRKKEETYMAIVDVTIIPIGTDSPSVSKYVAEIQEVLKTYEGKITYQLTPMSTLIEGELPVLFEVIQAIHEVPFKHGLQRVATNIRIDDRRDKRATMEGKVEAVQAHLSQVELETEPVQHKES
ncbi:hypothetical protein JCM9140_736 [Halalkalibacter wakoensis JCM 9140]|uniref:Thiamine-binding protein domain-containing protein n=2 Tax=Halalkalibacter wakoensis TaxID=127891 RepID=W4Q081_9BACI|nr:hypothetical protein JCM9140_736 [Halalkalibacter wakoensis JCM 9140]